MHLAEGVLPDHLTVVDDLQVSDLGEFDVEVVAPELDHPFVQLPRTEDGAVDPLCLQGVLHCALVEGIQCVAVLRELGPEGRHFRLDCRVVDARVVELRLKPGLVTHRLRGVQLRVRHSHGRAAHEARDGIGPFGWCHDCVD